MECLDTKRSLMETVEMEADISRSARRIPIIPCVVTPCRHERVMDFSQMGMEILVK
jgi:hypothetical protein